MGANDAQTVQRLPRGRGLRRPVAHHRLLALHRPWRATCPTTCASRSMAVNSGHWPLLRYDPRRTARGENPLIVDNKAPSIPYRDFINSETRFSLLTRTHPEDAERFLHLAQKHVDTRFSLYEQLAHLAVRKGPASE
ncbi:MAG: hypothetical protein MZV65_08750 [Chromatiales bacterium]|nr:hypothetical protein [Chromatiales bacterium]